MTTLDFLAASAVARARLLERAVHDTGPWQVQWGGVRVDAVRMRTPTRVILFAYFEQVPQAALDGDEVAWLYCDGEPVSSMEIPRVESSNRGVCVDWALIGPEVSADGAIA